MGYKFVTLIATCAILGLVLANPEHGRVRRDAEDYEDSIDADDGISLTYCPADAPVLSCTSCNTRLICKPVSNLGIVKPCRNPLKPYCNRGLCSAEPATEC